MHWSAFFGFAAALAVLTSFCMSTIVGLRSVAIASNVLFILYGTFAHIYPVLFLHVTLLPINFVKLYQAMAGPNLSDLRSLWRGNQCRPANRDDRLVFKQWLLGVIAFYAAVALLLVGLAIGDHPGTATVASARLGQTSAAINTSRLPNE